MRAKIRPEVGDAQLAVDERRRNVGFRQHGWQVLRGPLARRGQQLPRRVRECEQVVRHDGWRIGSSKRRALFPKEPVEVAPVAQLLTNVKKGVRGFGKFWAKLERSLE